jgi:hypothetical protein
MPKALRKEDGITSLPFSLMRVRVSVSMAIIGDNDMIILHCHEMDGPPPLFGKSKSPPLPFGVGDLYAVFLCGKDGAPAFSIRAKGIPPLRRPPSASLRV